jgi:hypothetical protein
MEVHYPTTVKPQPGRRGARPAAGAVKTARLTLEEIWRKLGPIVEEARSLDSQIVENPGLLSDKWVSAQTRWLQIFEREINAVETVYSTTEAGAKLSVGELKRASDAGRKLLDIVERGRELVASNQPVNGTTEP